LRHFFAPSATLALHATPAQARRAREVCDQALAAPHHSGPRIWVHGDLHPLNLVATAHTGAPPRLASVIGRHAFDDALID